MSKSEYNADQAIFHEVGMKLISGDFVQIQARILLAIAGQHDKCKLMAEGQDAYCDMASAIYKRPITKKDKAERQVGKNAVLGLGFGMGAEKFHAKYCKHMPIEFAQKVVDTYRNEWAPRVGGPYNWDTHERSLWSGLMRAATKAVHGEGPQKFNGIVYYINKDGVLICRSPAGFEIYYRHPKPEWREGERRTPTFTFKKWVRTGWQTIQPFGGMMTENIVMRIEVDIKNAAVCNLEKAGYPVVLDVHDELVCEVENPDPKKFEECMLDLPDWVREYGVPVAIDKPKILDRWR